MKTITNEDIERNLNHVLSVNEILQEGIKKIYYHERIQDKRNLIENQNWEDYQIYNSMVYGR